MDQHYFIFREPGNFDELKALLLLRYKVFRESRLEKFVMENETGIDLDCYDLYSRHFGMYEHTKGTSRPVGYVRMVTDQPGIFRDELFELSKSGPTLYEKVNRIPSDPFPLMNYCPYRDNIRVYHAILKSQGKSLVEAGRLSLDNSIRGLKIATNFVASIFASFLVHGVDETLVTCVSNHEVVYRSCGAIPFNGTTIFEVHGTGVCLLLLLLTAENLPESMKEKVYRMSEVYRKMGRICYDPSNPENYYAPLGSYVKSRPVFVAA